MWSELNGVLQTYDQLDPREEIHRRICANFQHDQQISDPDSFRRELCGLLLERDLPLLGSEGNKIGGRNAQDTRAPPASFPGPREPPSSLGGPAPSPGVPASLPGVDAASPGVPAQSPGGRAPSHGVPAQSPEGAVTSPGGPKPPLPSPETPSPGTKPPVWRRLCPCLNPRP